MDVSVSQGLSHTTAVEINSADPAVSQRTGAASTDSAQREQRTNAEASEVRSNTSIPRINSNHGDTNGPNASSSRGSHIFVVHEKPKVSVLSNTAAHDPERYWGIKNLLYMILSKYGIFYSATQN
jgi:hypothetical protein